KHRGHVACPQASLSIRSTAPRPGRDGCATRPPSRQEQGADGHAPTRRPQRYDRHLPYCLRRAGQRLRERVSSCRVPSVACPVRVSSCDPQCPRSAQQGHAMRHETRPVTVRTRWLTIDEGCMSSPAPSAAHVLECTSVKFAVHKQRKINLPGERCIGGSQNFIGPPAPTLGRDG